MVGVNYKRNSIWYLMILFAILVLIQDIAYVWFANVSEYVTIIAHILQIAVVVGFIAVNRISIKGMFNNKNLDIILIFVSFFCGIAIMVLGSCVDSIISLFIYMEVDNSENSFWYTIFAIVYPVFIASVFEEIEFRGLLFQNINDNHHGPIMAMIISSFMFALLHTGSVNAGAFILGIFSSLIYSKTQNLIYSIVMHFSGNLITGLLILVSLFQEHDGAEVVVESMTANETIVSIIIGVIFFAFFFFIFALILTGLMLIMIGRIKKRNMSNNLVEIGINSNKKTNILTNGFWWTYIFICIVAWTIQLF